MKKLLQAAAVESEAALLPLIELVYQAVEDTSLWPTVLDKLGGMVKCESVVLVANYADSLAKDIMAIARGDAAMFVPYAEHYASVNVWTESCDRMFPPGTVRYSHQAVHDNDLEKTEFYTDWLKPNGIAYGFGVEIGLGDQVPALLSCLRSRRIGPFEEKEGLILKMLLPHFQRALRLHWQLAQLRSNAKGMEAALDAFDHAVFGLNRWGRIVFLNSAGLRIAQAGDGIRLINDRMIATDATANTQLQSLITAMMPEGFGSSAGGVLQVPRRGGPPLSVTVTPFASRFSEHSGSLVALIFISDPSGKIGSRAAILRSLYKLSPSEARLATLLAQGMDIRLAADWMRITYSSARSMLKLIFQKTHVSSQSMLLRLILHLPGDMDIHR